MSLELQFAARTTGPSSHLSMTVEDAEEVNMTFDSKPRPLLIVLYQGKGAATVYTFPLSPGDCPESLQSKENRLRLCCTLSCTDLI